MGKSVTSVASDAIAAAGDGERDVVTLPGQIPWLESEAKAEACGPRRAVRAGRSLREGRACLDGQLQACWQMVS